MSRITFEEYTNAINLVVAYKEQCKKDIDLIDVGKIDLKTINTDLKNAIIGETLIVRKDSPNTTFIKGETYEIIDKNTRELFIRKKSGIIGRIRISNGASRWGYF